jgi:hypothetical protein
MINFDQFFPDNLYHSYIIESDIENTHIHLIDFLKNKNIISQNSGDILFEKYNSFSIDDSQLIRDWHSKKNIDNKRICIIDTKFINNEAEKTLLKILEEPKMNTHFFIILPDASFLLDTIKSRVHIIKVSRELEGDKIAEDFIKLKLSDKFDFIQKMTKETKENSSVVRSNTINLLNSLEAYIYKKFKNDKNKENISLLEELSKSKRFLSVPGSSPKMILENIAIMMD